MRLQNHKQRRPKEHPHVPGGTDGRAKETVSNDKAPASRSSSARTSIHSHGSSTVRLVLQTSARLVAD